MESVALWDFIPETLIIVCIVSYLTIYLRGIHNGTVKPVLSTWLFFACATILSLITDFRESGIQGLIGNSYNLIDTVAGFTILIAIICRRDTQKTFSEFEKRCLYVVIAIGFLWLLSGQNVLAHLSVQIIMFIAYLPMYVKLWRAHENTESLAMWSLDSIASIIGTIRPTLNHDILPFAYGFRSTVCTLVTVILILRLKFKKKKHKVGCQTANSLHFEQPKTESGG